MRTGLERERERTGGERERTGGERERENRCRERTSLEIERYLHTNMYNY